LEEREIRFEEGEGEGSGDDEASVPDPICHCV
jgi:hypothetical protein